MAPSGVPKKPDQILEPNPETKQNPEQEAPIAPINPISYTCSGKDCDKPAKMQCPTCVKYNGDVTYFCEQECFKKNWAVHSRIHPELRSRFEFKPPLYPYTGSLRPAYVTPQIKVIDPKIKKPDYALTGNPVSERTARATGTVAIYTKDEINGIRSASKLTRNALDYACNLIKPGITPDEIDKKTHEFIIINGGYPSPLNYHNFPKSICCSINEVICHGIPDTRPLEEGDIINIDVSVYLNGFHGDANETHHVGNKIDFESFRLMKASYDSLFSAINLVKPNILFRDFGEMVSLSIRKHGFSSVSSYCGHGIGHFLHAAPDIPHYSRNKASGSCKAGMIFCIEPMINAGSQKDDHWPDNWTAVTVDGKRSAQYEHTILCLDSGYELLTKRTENSKKFWWEMKEYQNELIKYEKFISNSSHSSNSSKK